MKLSVIDFPGHSTETDVDPGPLPVELRQEVQSWMNDLAQDWGRVEIGPEPTWNIYSCNVIALSALNTCGIRLSDEHLALLKTSLERITLSSHAAIANLNLSTDQRIIDVMRDADFSNIRHQDEE